MRITKRLGKIGKNIECFNCGSWTDIFDWNKPGNKAFHMCVMGMSPNEINRLKNNYKKTHKLGMMQSKRYYDDLATSNFEHDGGLRKTQYVAVWLDVSKSFYRKMDSHRKKYHPELVPEEYNY
jgi:hypothetical protein